MRAAVTSGPGGPVSVTDVAAPDLKSGEALVRVCAASVNRLDVAVHQGLAFGAPITFPLIQGLDAAGVVEQGSGAIPTGTRVVVKPTIACRRCRPCLRHRAADCVDSRTVGIHRPGGYAEFVAIPRTNLFVLPDAVTFAAGAAAAHVHPIVLRMIRAAGVQPAGSTMMVTGAGGALGTAAVQLGRALGFEVVAVASSDAKLEIAAREGAAMVANRSAHGGRVADAVRTATDGAGADLVIETTGDGAVVADAFEALARGGRMVVVGARGGAELALDVLDLYRTRRGVIGSSGCSDAEFREAFDLMAEHGIEPVVGGRFALDEVRSAFEAVADRARIGKIVIEIGADAARTPTPKPAEGDG